MAFLRISFRKTILNRITFTIKQSNITQNYSKQNKMLLSIYYGVNYTGHWSVLPAQAAANDYSSGHYRNNALHDNLKTLTFP
jgi:hypothetical protein